MKAETEPMPMASQGEVIEKYEPYSLSIDWVVEFKFDEYYYNNLYDKYWKNTLKDINKL